MVMVDAGNGVSRTRGRAFGGVRPAEFMDIGGGPQSADGDGRERPGDVLSDVRRCAVWMVMSSAVSTFVRCVGANGDVVRDRMDQRSAGEHVAGARSCALGRQQGGPRGRGYSKAAEDAGGRGSGERWTGRGRRRGRRVAGGGGGGGGGGREHELTAQAGKADQATARGRSPRERTSRGPV